MITRSTSSWQHDLKNVVKDPIELLQLLDLDKKYLPAAQRAALSFPLRVPLSFVARMQKGRLDDPLLRQVLPIEAEMLDTDGYTPDPLQEAAANPRPGLLHKYQGRVLLVVTGACAVHCRYCFRRHFPYADNTPGKAGWREALTYIAQDPSIEEVILSGGDPLSAPDHYLAELVNGIAAISHIKRLRVHTRIPIVLPSRVTSELIGWLTATRLRPVMIVHINHAQEINEEVSASLQLLKNAGVLLLNQTVLLRGINDSVETLIALSEKLCAVGVVPYYIYVLDKVAGAAHFDVDELTAKKIIQAMIERTSGYLVPKLVREVPGAPSKIRI
jgi:L-lysine 2,3-aminomutase